MNSGIVSGVCDEHPTRGGHQMKTVVVLAERLDNSTHGVLAEVLDYCIDGNVWLDASGVEFLGGRSLELLVSASRTVAS